mmetsp:Transcript_20716/g.39431  ORF Transcript_20716/g.39431 Transcript_20716/m.39431 type:complete len:1285 (-) Transcript_20716:129-3983(-)
MNEAGQPRKRAKAEPEASKRQDGASNLSVLGQACANHVESFNALLEGGLDGIVSQMDVAEVDPREGTNDPAIQIQLTELYVTKPTNMLDSKDTHDGGKFAGRTLNILPVDCRVGHFTYAAPLHGKFELRVTGKPQTASATLEIGRIPIMVKSKACYLHGKSPQQLVELGEDQTECGGYFIVNGNERVVRMLIMPRANYPMAIIRPSYESRGHLYTKYATLFRGMRRDGSTQTNTLHYLLDGSCWMRFSHGREEWFIPLVAIAYCFYPLTDELFVQQLCGTGEHWSMTFLRERALVMLQHQRTKHKISNQRDAYSYIGKTFRITLGLMIPRRWTNEEVGKWMMNRFVLVHTQDPVEKLQTLCLMWQKLMGLVREQLEPDNQDVMSSHEILLPGQLYGLVLKESLETMMERLKAIIAKSTRPRDDVKAEKKATDYIKNERLLEQVIKAASKVSNDLQYFVATGNVNSRSGLDLMQKSGYTIVADKLNQARFSSHFAAVHRGQYFAEMKTTTVRKLLPETWGFLCPVHTPDGSPCGLLNHMARSAKAVIHFPSAEITQSVTRFLSTLGVDVYPGEKTDLPTYQNAKYAWVMLDGRPVGRLAFDRLDSVAQELRRSKVAGRNGIPRDMEIVPISPDWKYLFPGLFLFLGPSRLIRPVHCHSLGTVEWIGPLEQVFMNIAMTGKETEEARVAVAAAKDSAGKELVQRDEDLPEQKPIEHTHQEIKPTEIFSVLAALTPFSNHNQSPRNMYQCQMLKQTMGTPYHNHPYRTDNKVYKIWCPQKPIVRTEMYNQYNFDEHPQGTNAIVAVITYTGYDMEDSMIINKHSFERGFGHGIVYKTKIIEAGDKNMRAQEKAACMFTNLRPEFKGGGRYVKDVDPATGEFRLQDDGLPPIGIKMENGDPLCCWAGPDGREKVVKFHDDLEAYVENVTRVHPEALPGAQAEPGMHKVLIKLRYPRNPVVGDKFSSRHGQKGVMSRLWPAEDMPFSESGVTPDIMFNPHGFPSRMTIGMLIESIAAKAAAAEGKPVVDGTTFRGYAGHLTGKHNNEKDPFLQKESNRKRQHNQEKDGNPVYKYFGDTLVKHGFQRLGTEKLYSGIHGTEMETDIFMGVIYYQRLRHMVGDKAQARMRGPVDRLTNQPVKGRQKHGGIRFGEMERDSLLAHGTAYLLHDRLCRSSDFDVGFVCPMCESILTPQANAHLKTGLHSQIAVSGQEWECPPCSRKMKRSVICHPVPIPWIFRFLTCELAAMNVRLQIKVKSRGREASMLPRSDVTAADAKKAGSGAAAGSVKK